MDHPGPKKDASAGLDWSRDEALRLVRAKRYEEALTLLYRARADAPHQPDLQASIQQIKEFLAGSYAKRLGGLDRVAGPVPVTAARSADALLVARYVDGIATLDDIAQMCPLGRLRTLQVLIDLYASGAPPDEARADAPAASASTVDGDIVAADTRAHEAASTWTFTPAPATLVARSAADITYREQFSLGMTAFVQRRYAEAAASFGRCLELRADDDAARVLHERAQAEARTSAPPASPDGSPR